MYDIIRKERNRTTPLGVDTYFMHSRFYINRQLKFWWKLEQTDPPSGDDIEKADREAIGRWGA